MHDLRIREEARRESQAHGEPDQRGEQRGRGHGETARDGRAARRDEGDSAPQSAPSSPARESVSTSVMVARTKTASAAGRIRPPRKASASATGTMKSR